LESDREVLESKIGAVTRPSREVICDEAGMVRVLVVDDSPTMRAFIRAALDDDGDLEVVEAASGFEAMRLLPRGTFACVVTDVNMPDINGLELVAHMRKSEYHKATPIILISTQTSERDQQRGLLLGANAFLAKPFEAHDLRDLVRAHIAVRSNLPTSDA
jgi:two-component system chemotaxis response regulator CheY